MAIICIEKNKNYATRFYYLDRLGKRQRFYKSGFRSEKEALKYEISEKERLENTVKTKTNYTLSEFIDEVFLPSRVNMGVSIATLQGYQNCVPRIKQGLGHLPLAKVNEDHCQEFLNQNKSPASRDQYRKYLTAIFNFGKFKRILRENPMDFVILPQYKSKKIAPYNFNDVKILLDTLQKDEQYKNLYTPVILAFFFSMTREEVTALLETDLDNRNYSIQINKACVVGLGQKTIGKQKTESRNRSAYANEFIFDQIHWYKDTYNVDNDFVCVNTKGDQLLPDTLSSRFSEFIGKHNLKYITFHKIRNTFGNLCKQAGIDSDTIYRMFGHANYKTTVEHYNSADEVLLRQAVGTLTDKIFDTVTTAKALAKDDFSM